jgi:16S rRNA (guanine(966)-N(2))-methyltransferase RsmD
MRVISGSARGLKLKAPEGLATRPTTDRIKESLFNIIAPYLPECRFLDLFSGSGAIGIEALSRNAEKSIFVDASTDSINIIKKNVTAARLTERAEIVKSDVLAAIDMLGRRGEKFDIIFMDPPYNKELALRAIEKIANADILADDGFIIAEQSQDEDLPIVDGMEVYRVKDYKITKMTFMKKAD